MEDITKECPFCQVDESRILASRENCFALLDLFAVSEGHTLIIPRRHVANYFELSPEEQGELWDFVNECQKILQEKYSPDGFNVGINVNAAAGQSIPHVHIHLIPRYEGDVANPRGGVRGVIPAKQNY